MKKIVFTVLFGFTLLILISIANAAPFNIAGPSQDGVDTDPATSVFLDVMQTGIITDLNLFISIDSFAPGAVPGWADNVDIYLIHGGTTVHVYDGTGDTEEAYIFATFDDQASDSYPDTGTVDGTFKSSPDLLSSFNGLELSGLWELKIWDRVAPDDGNVLYAWNISGTTAEPIPEPATMLLLGSGLIGLAGLGRKKLFKRG